MPECVAPGCTTSDKSNPDKLHRFSVPRDEENSKKWMEALRSLKPLGKKATVCEKHFRKKDIIRVRLLTGPDGQVLGVSPYSRPKLKPGAVPYWFPWTEADDDPDEPDVMTVLLKSSSGEKNDTVKINIVDNLPGSPSPSPEEPVSSTESPQVDETSDKDQSFTFSDLQKASIPLAPTWTKFNQRRGSEAFVTFTEITFSKDKNENFHSVVLKEIVIDSNLEARVYVLGEKINSEDHGVETKITSEEMLKKMIGVIYGKNICRGCTMPEAETDARGNKLKRDCQGDFRHETCELLTLQTRCKFCRLMRRSYLVREKRRKKRMSKEGDGDSDIKKKATVRILQKKIRRRDKRIEALFDENKRLKKLYVHLMKKCDAERVQEN